jgi:hypothetical protein
MRVTTEFVVGTLILSLAGGGCATSRMGNPFAAAAARSNREPGRRTESSLAGRDTRSRWDANVDADDNGFIRRNGAGSAAGSSRNSPIARQEAATLALINEELRDAPVEERQRIAADMKGMHPDMVRQFLRAYKMGQKAHRQQVEVAQLQHTQDYRERLAQPQLPGGSAEAGATGTMQRGPSAELGNASAWGHTTNYTARDGGANSAGGTNPVQTAGHTTMREISPGLYRQAAVADPNDSVVHAHVRDQNAVDSRVVAAGHESSAPAGGYGAAPASSGSAPASKFDRPSSGPDGSKAPLLGLGNLIPGVYNNASKNNAGQNPSTGANGAIQRADYNANSAGGPSASPMQALAVRGPTESPPASSDHPWPVQLQLAIAAAEREVAFAPPGANDAEKHAYIEKHVFLRMLYLMAGHQERALQAIPGINAADQEFWQQTFWGLANYFDINTIPAPEARATQTVAQLTTALLRLQEKAQLELRNVTFCHKIASFGNYERFPRDEFTPGQEVLLYAEVGNIHSESTTDGRFRTLLKSTLEIYQPGPQGTRIEQIELPAPATEDVCRTHRRDYFHSYQFAIPPKLASGPYVLKLTVEDQLSRRVVSYSLNFTVK